ncbi:MAG: type IV pilus twitching motility protein PilT, partial [Pirellulales bacterium]
MSESTPVGRNAGSSPSKPAQAASPNGPAGAGAQQASAAAGQLRSGATRTEAADGLVDFQIGPDNATHVMEMLLREMAAAGEAGGKARAKATDMHLNVGRAPDYRIERVIRGVMSKPLTERDVALLSDALMSDHQRERFTTNHCVDLSYHLGSDRFRVNIVECFNGRSVSIRRFEQIKDFSQYHLPEQYLRIAEGHRGFVIMSGSTGSGKTTSIAAMLDHVNRTFHRKIVTIEDPIEYVYVPKRSIIVQMEIGDDGIPTEDIALRNLVRMDPDVGLAGEMRDRASLEAALKTAQAGHLIFGTLH